MSEASFTAGLEVAFDGGTLTQSALAKALGVSRQLVSDWRRGRRRPSVEQVFSLERHLDLPPGSLSRHLGYVPADAEIAVVTDVVGRVRARVPGLLDDAGPELGHLVADLDDFADRAADTGTAMELLRLAIEDFEREHGPATAEEMRRAHEQLEVAARRGAVA